MNNKHEHLVIATDYSEELAELFGILLGDGSVERYFTRVYLNLAVEREYSLYVKCLFETIFSGVPVSIIERPIRGTLEIQVSSVDAGTYLRRIGFNSRERSVPKWILGNRNFKKAAIRGLFDTEGTVGIKYYRGKSGNAFYKQLTVTNINKNILSFIESALVEEGYKPTLRSKKNIYISNKQDIQRYIEEIGSHNSKLLRKLNEQQIRDYKYGGLRRVMHS